MLLTSHKQDDVMVEEEFPSWLQKVYDLELLVLGKSVDRPTRIDLHRKLRRIRQDMHLLGELLVFFESAPRYQIAGEEGVAKQMEKSRTTIKKIIDEFGLETNDFQQPDISVFDLLKKSESFTLKIDELLEFHGTHMPVT